MQQSIEECSRGCKDPVKESSREGGDDVTHGTHGPSTLPHQSHIVRVSSKTADVLLHPLQSQILIMKSKVACNQSKKYINIRILSFNFILYLEHHQIPEKEIQKLQVCN